MIATRPIVLAVILLPGLAGVASAQTPAQPPPPMGAGRGVNQMYTTIKTYLSESAGAMADADFAYRPTADVRTFGEIIGHVANAGFSTCAGIAGEANPNKENLEQKGADKAAASGALQAMFAFCDKAFAIITDENAAELVTRGPRQIARIVPAASLVAHLNEHYGNLVTYMRLKGLVPPSTKRAAGR